MLVFKKKLSFTPDMSASGTALAVREFVASMDNLEKAHGYPVRMVKAVSRLGFITIYYELIKETTNDK